MAINEQNGGTLVFQEGTTGKEQVGQNPNLIKADTSVKYLNISTDPTLKSTETSPTNGVKSLQQASSEPEPVASSNKSVPVKYADFDVNPQSEPTTPSGVKPIIEGNANQEAIAPAVNNGSEEAQKPHAESKSGSKISGESPDGVDPALQDLYKIIKP